MISARFGLFVLLCLLINTSINASIRINEIHYDNMGTDVDQFIEIRHREPLTGYEIILYNGANGLLYNRTLLTSIPATSSSGGFNYTVVKFNQLANNIEGVALVKPNDDVIEFLSYEGTFLARNGPANGTRSIDIRVSESSQCTKIGYSLQKCVGTTKWVGPVEDTMGYPNVNCTGLVVNTTCGNTPPVSAPVRGPTPVMVPVRSPIRTPTRPNNDTAPTSPTAPTAPTAPTSPTAPTTPTAPTSPTAPTAPTPVAPIAPIRPTPTAPIRPSPTAPTKPSKPTRAPIKNDPAPTTPTSTKKCGLFHLGFFCPFKCGYFKRKLGLC